MGFAHFAYGFDGVTILGVAVATSEAGRALLLALLPKMASAAMLRFAGVPPLRSATF